jgi:ribonuclease HII
MTELGDRYPAYDFASHKGYVTPEHNAALRAHGPCPEHRFSYVNVARVSGVARLPFGRLGVRLWDEDNEDVGDLLSDPVPAELASWA